MTAESKDVGAVEKILRGRATVDIEEIGRKVGLSVRGATSAKGSVE